MQARAVSSLERGRKVSRETRRRMSPWAHGARNSSAHASESAARTRPPATLAAHGRARHPFDVDGTSAAELGSPRHPLSALWGPALDEHPMIRNLSLATLVSFSLSLSLFALGSWLHPPVHRGGGLQDKPRSGRAHGCARVRRKHRDVPRRTPEDRRAPRAARRGARVSFSWVTFSWTSKRK